MRFVYALLTRDKMVVKFCQPGGGTNRGQSCNPLRVDKVGLSLPRQAAHVGVPTDDTREKQ